MVFWTISSVQQYRWQVAMHGSLKMTLRLPSTEILGDRDLYFSFRISSQKEFEYLCRFAARCSFQWMSSNNLMPASTSLSPSANFETVTDLPLGSGSIPHLTQRPFSSELKTIVEREVLIIGVLQLEDVSSIVRKNYRQRQRILMPNDVTRDDAGQGKMYKYYVYTHHVRSSDWNLLFVLSSVST
jgi:hypothetical protein